MLHAHLPAALAGACPGIKFLDCCGQKDIRLEFSFVSCPPSLHSLLCSFTQVRLLGPLSMCTMLQTLNCSYTKVSEMGPLSACTRLQTLNCSVTGVTELGPL